MSETTLKFTPVEDIEKIRNELRAGFYSGKMKSIPYRKHQLLQLAYMVQDNVKRFEDAFAHDLGRPQLESDFLDIGPVTGEIMQAYKGVEKWAKTESPPFSLNWTPMRPAIRKEAKGTVLIISPFNYPVWLSLGPLAGALAAGNSVLLKPSEQTPAISSLMTELLAKYLDNDIIQVANGAVEVTTKILELQWDHILYTGGGKIGRIIATAAAKHLTPVSLELGGKSPVIVDPSCDLATTARRLLWGKLANAGQTCVAPDYILVPKDFQETLVEAFKKAYDEFFPPGQPISPTAMSHLIHAAAFNRVKNLIANTKGKVVLGGLAGADEATKFIPLTVVQDVNSEDVLMQEEIFGPVLPILPIESLDDAVPFINARDHPLALYVFSQDSAFKAKVFDNTQSGACLANETNIHPGADGLPFGGTGPSGYGQHTGKFGFDMFTHLRATLDSPSWIDRFLAFRFPPYNEKKTKAAQKITSVSLPARPSKPPSFTSLASQNSSRARWALLALALAIVAWFSKNGGLANSKYLSRLVRKA